MAKKEGPVVEQIGPALTNKVTRAFKSGKRTIEINGVKMKMTLQTRNPKFKSGGEIRTQVEKWIVVSTISPRDKQWNFSIEYGNNSRVKVA